MTDTQTTLFECKQIIDTFLKERDWHQFHSPKVDSMGLVVEAGELLELFLFCQPSDGGQRVLLEKRESVEDELADCFFWVLCFANTSSLDLTKVLQREFLGDQAGGEEHTTLFDLKTLIGEQTTTCKELTNFAMTISSKASFLMNAFLDEAHDEMGHLLLKEKRVEIELLLLQVFVATINFSTAASIDIAAAFLRKMQKNREKYPIEKSKGTSKKYTDL